MLTNITRFFETCLKAPVQDTEADKEQRLRLACAALLLDEEEIAVLKNLLRGQFGLDGKELEELWQLAREQVVEATSLYQFTTLINENYDHAAKTRLLSYMWEVAYADGRLDRYEEHMIRKVADLLYLSHKDFIQTKLAVRPDSQ